MKEEVSPIIQIDNREQLPLVFKNLRSERATLTTGDYSIRGLENEFACERKSISDLTQCCTGDNRARFKRELLRLRGYDFVRLVVVGTVEDIREHRYRSEISPQSVLGTLAAIEARGVPVCFSPTPESAALLIENWAVYFLRERVKNLREILEKNIA